MLQTYREYRKEMEAGMPDKIRVDFSQPITPEILGREFSDAWKERYGRELVDWAETLNAHRHEFQRVADTVSKVVIPTYNRLKESGIIEAAARTATEVADVTRRAAERQEMMKSLVAPLAHDFLPSQSTWPRRGPQLPDRESEMDALAERVAEKLYAKMTTPITNAQVRVKPIDDSDRENIRSLTMVEPGKSDRHIIVINENYEEPLIVGREQKSWDILFRVAEGERIGYSTVKDQVDYLTTNRRCKLYTTTKYPLCKILLSVGGLVVAGVDLKIIGGKAYKQRVAKAVAAKMTT